MEFLFLHFALQFPPGPVLLFPPVGFVLRLWYSGSPYTVWSTWAVYSFVGLWRDKAGWKLFVDEWHLSRIRLVE